MGRQRMNLVGEKFGRLTILEFAFVKNKASYFKCKCDCGNDFITKGNRLRSNQVKSCGCLKNELVSARARASRGIAKPSRSVGYQQASINYLFTVYKRGARRRNLSFSLDKEVFISLTSSNCFYCGCKPSQVVKGYGYGDYIYNGVDRKNNIIGYELNNCVASCSTCNYAKRTMNIEEFFLWIERVYNKCIVP